MEYQKYEFCKAVLCPYLSGKCIAITCIHTAKEFHEWLKANDYIIKKKDINEIKRIQTI